MTDETRNQYSTYTSYLKRKSSNRWYNLGSAAYSEMVKNSGGVDAVMLKNAYQYLIKALWFDKHDVDARKFITQMCEKWDDEEGWDAEARKEWKNES